MRPAASSSKRHARRIGKRDQDEVPAHTDAARQHCRRPSTASTASLMPVKTTISTDPNRSTKSPSRRSTRRGRRRCSIDTRSGLRINARCQVVDMHEAMIAGLYSCGETAGGFSEHGLARATCQGRIAGMNAPPNAGRSARARPVRGAARVDGCRQQRSDHRANRQGRGARHHHQRRARLYGHPVCRTAGRPAAFQRTETSRALERRARRTAGGPALSTRRCRQPAGGAARRDRRLSLSQRLGTGRRVEDPVLVFIYGGGFVLGTGAAYDGSLLAATGKSSSSR